MLTPRCAIIEAARHGLAERRRRMQDAGVVSQQVGNGRLLVIAQRAGKQNCKRLAGAALVADVAGDVVIAQ
nr:hypothetical protein [Paraburkholderia sp. BL8N3]